MKSQVSTDGIYAKITRAQKQLRWLEADFSQFCESQRLFISHEVDRSAGRQTWVFRGETPRVPIEFSTRVGEIVHNLRSALDHLVWQLVIANGAEPSSKNEFPIFRDAKKYQDNVRWDLQGVSPGAKSKIEWAQPFQKHGGIGSQLWILHCLNNIDKHRHVHMAVLYSGGAQIEILDEPEQLHRPPIAGHGRVGRLQRDEEIVVLNDPDSLVSIEFLLWVQFGTSVLDGPLVDATFSDTIEAEFDQVEKHGPVGQPVVETLRMCLQDVRAVCSNFGLDFSAASI